MVAVRGSSGAGKSTFLHVLAGLLRPRKGSVHWGDTDIAATTEAGRAAFRRANLGIVFQDFLLFDELGAEGNAAIAQAFAPQADRPRLRGAAADWLARMGLGTAGGRSVASFSGGERQRIAVARALSGDPAVILADEPTAALDRANADALADDLVRVAVAGGRMLIVVTHDPAIVGRMNRVIDFADGRVVADTGGQHG
jgi:ABC-type lipoprotein export system ATPase subunit